MEKHTHKYIRVKLGKDKKRILYKCALPGCVHSIEPQLAVGRFSICNYDGNEFVMTKESIRLAKPHCGCQRAVNRDKNKIAELLGILE